MISVKIGDEMTDLLTSATLRQGCTHDGDAGRPLTIGACTAGVGAAVSMLLVTMALGLAGWFAADAGSHGDTRDALRVGADAWLLAHGAQLSLPQATISVIPLGLTFVCGYVVYRMGRWAGATSAVDDVRTALTGSTVLAAGYGVVATVAAVLASQATARPDPGLACLGGFLLAFLAGGLGIVSGSGRWPLWRERVPQGVLAVGSGAVTGVLLVLVAGSLLATGALLLDFGAAANVLSRLQTDAAGGLLYTLVVATVAPNAAVLAGAYLTGPGFMVGTGTLVSPSAVVLGPVPAFPLLAALPDEGAAPSWTVLLAAVPVLAGALAAVLSVRRYPVPGYEVGALRGLLLGCLGGLAFGLLGALAGGSVGPGRMSEVGALVVETAVAATVAMGVGGLLGGLAATWWQRRR